MELVELKTNIRTGTGKGYARELRREGKIPAVLYGPGSETLSLSLLLSDFEQVIKKNRSSPVVLNLVIQNGDSYTKHAIIKEIQSEPVTNNLRHIDFYEIAMDRKIMVKVPVVATGRAIGVELGGTLQLVRRELEVLCLPMEIPEVIEIEVTELDIGDSFHVKDIPLEDNIEIQADVNFTVVTILSPKKEEEVVEETEEEGEEVTEGEETPEAESE
mgnify:CR=1 FL=1